MQEPGPLVYVVAIDGTIDLGLAPLLERAVREARDAGAAAVLLDIDTFGGRVDAAVAMRDALVNAPVRTIAFVNPRAISAGALIALATETIVMARGGTMGAAMPVVGGTGPPQAADEKSVSYVRKEFGATAERRGRPTRFAEAMVDADVEIDGVVAKGKLLTLTTDEAIEHRIADHVADSLEAALEAAGVGGATLHTVQATWAEDFVRFLTNPVVSSLLMSLGVLGLLVEIRTPGFGVPGLVGGLSLALFLWGHWIVQLAGWEEGLLLVVGALLIAVEVLVIPGFGIAGLAGLVCLVAGLGMTLVGEGATVAVIVRALGRVAVSLLLAMGAGLLLIRALPRLPFGRQLVLETGMSAEQGYASAPVSDRRWLGSRGVTLSPLRPAGLATFDGERVDVVSDGDFVPAGAGIEVVRVTGNRIVVRETRRDAKDGGEHE